MTVPGRVRKIAVTAVMGELSTQKVAIVTGSTRGIGRAIALRLAGDGYTVVVNYRADDSAAASVLAEIDSLAPGSIVVKADVSTPEGAETVIGRAVEALGGLDVLVNNVGPFLVKPLVDTKVSVSSVSVSGF